MDPFSQMMAMQRMGIQEDRQGLQEQRYADQMQQAAVRNRLAALQSGMRMNAPGSPEHEGLNEELYGMATDGDRPGATTYNYLQDQDRFWKGVRETGMQNQAGRTQGLYRVGDEYGFNGKPMGNLGQEARGAGMDPDTYFSKLQGEHLAKAQSQQQALRGGMDDGLQQSMMQQAAAERAKAVGSDLAGFKSTYGITPGAALGDYDPASQTLALPGDPDTFGRPTPPKRVPLPMAARQKMLDLLAQQSGFNSHDEMNQSRQGQINAAGQIQQQVGQALTGFGMDSVQAALGGGQGYASEEGNKDAELQELEALHRKQQQAQMRSKAALHRMQLFMNPEYRGEFFGNLGQESQAHRSAAMAPRGYQGAPLFNLGAMTK